ncbi:hypothetical protein JW890_05145 [candidate division WOR-3 bacterium]|nr:hypothetical protein [candidate division WOR-3 bacterium]
MFLHFILISLCFQVIENTSSQFEPLSCGRNFSFQIFELDSLIAHGKATDGQILKRAFIGLQRGQTSSSLDLLRSISDNENAAGLTAREELLKWSPGDPFPSDTVFVSDSLTGDSFVRHIKLFTQNEIQIPYNPLIENVALQKAWTTDSSVPGNMFSVNIISEDSVIGGYSLFYFLPSLRGAYVEIKMTGFFSGFLPLLPRFSNNPVSYSMSFRREDYSYQPADFEELYNLITERFREEILMFKNNPPLFSSPETAFAFLRREISVLDIPVGMSGLKFRETSEIIRQKRATPFEIALLLSNAFAENDRWCVFAVERRSFQNSDGVTSLPNFDRVFLVADDTLWIDASLESPFGHIPGEYQNSTALNLFTGNIASTPWLEPSRSRCFIIQEADIGAENVRISLSITLTGEFLRIAQNDPFLEDKLKNGILVSGRSAVLSDLSVENFSDSKIIRIEYSEPKISYQSGYYSVRLFKPTFFTSLLKPSRGLDVILMPFAASVIQTMTVKSDNALLPHSDILLETPFGRASLETRIENRKTTLTSCAVFRSEKISFQLLAAWEEFDRTVREDVFPEFLVFGRN